eukprot:TRINITY_DN8637_c0_g1_i1.p3 TRINITY_DN8637_c0_g1~~TRINITY_DN8637_c0_g1_i1.p3  ORF type:complete len:66 (-),score=7.79 TRINITY_DN8637_c0_g1_i1:15-212(-)
MSFAMQEHLLRMHDQMFNLRPDLQGRAPGAPSAREILDAYKEKQTKPSTSTKSTITGTSDLEQTS